MILLVSGTFVQICHYVTLSGALWGSSGPPCDLPTPSYSRTEIPHVSQDIVLIGVAASQKETGVME